MLRSWVGRLRNTFVSDFCPLSDEESKKANECKQRTLSLLNDALKKKDSLLVDDPEKFADQRKSVEKRVVPLISIDLVKELISKLQKVTFKGNKDQEMEKYIIAYVRPSSETETIYLCKGFWEQTKFLKMNSRPETLIHEVCHLLGYAHTIKENEEKTKTSPQYKLCPVSVKCIETAFSFLMNHRESYINGSYSCCGETSRDTLCEKSLMAEELRNPSELHDYERLFLEMMLLKDIWQIFIVHEWLEIMSMTKLLQKVTVPDKKDPCMTLK